MPSMMDCLYAKCTPYITDCVMAEMEKMGSKFRVALRIAKDKCFQRLPCLHKGTYADDCLVQRVTQHKCYIVATCDKDLRRRIRKIPGIPIMYISQHKFSIERMPDAFGAPKTQGMLNQIRYCKNKNFALSSSNEKSQIVNKIKCTKYQGVLPVPVRLYQCQSDPTSVSACVPLTLLHELTLTGSP